MIIVRGHGPLDGRKWIAVGRYAGPRPRPLICDCLEPLPLRVGGIWWGCDVYECRMCRRKVIT